MKNMESRMFEGGRAYVADFIEKIKNAQTPQEVEDMYLIGMIILRGKVDGLPRGLINWQAINDAIKKRFGSGALDQIKGTWAKRAQRYAISASDEELQQAVDETVRNQ